MPFITFDFQFLNAPFWLEKTSEDACNLSICMNGSPNMPFWLILELGSECIHYRTFTIAKAAKMHLNTCLVPCVAAGPTA